MTLPLAQLRRLRSARSLWLAGLLLLAPPARTFAQSSSSPTRPDYSAFRIIAERNIFNAGRSGRTSRGNRENAPRPSRVAAFTLVGTLSCDRGLFAFFDGSDSGFRKAVKPHESIGGHRVAAIAPNGVTLEADGKTIELRVGMQMRREDDGPWEAGERRNSSERRDFGERRETSLTSSSSGTPAGEAASDAPTAEESEILKKLMQQRERESQ